jgi:NTP pyrophosphatase (non-canonical NTP hydrolase)
MASAYTYCPWCGRESAMEPLRALIAEALEKVEAVQKNITSTRISRMESELVEIERELDRILS